MLPTQVDICATPQTIADKTAAKEFKMSPLGNEASLSTPTKTQSLNSDSLKSVLNTPASAGLQSNQNITFSISETGATSTPARQVAEPLSAFNVKPIQKASVPPAWSDSSQSMTIAKDGSSKSGMYIYK